MFLWEIGGHTKKNQKEGNYAWNHNATITFDLFPSLQGDSELW